MESTIVNNNQKMYGYVRVSTASQEVGRQVDALLNFGIPKERIFIDKYTGRTFNRPEYITLKRMLKDSPGSLLVMLSLDRLGRNYKEIQQEWKELTTECKADIKILDMDLLDTRNYKDFLGSFVSDIILQILSFEAQNEYNNIKKRQEQGIEHAKRLGKKMGRPRIEITEEFIKEWKIWREGKQTAVEAIHKANLKPNTFYRLAKELDKKENISC